MIRRPRPGSSRRLFGRPYRLDPAPKDGESARYTSATDTGSITKPVAFLSTRVMTQIRRGTGHDAETGGTASPDGNRPGGSAKR